jgi:RHS repeat-associated protein
MRTQYTYSQLITVPYSFQAQEHDDEVKGDGNSVNYKYRMHDPRLGRFFAIDPLVSSYPFYSPYAFSGNEVIAAVEIEGLEPGRMFETPREAAIDWAFHYADQSIRSNKEYASCIYVVKEGDVVKYTYSKPNIGSAHNSKIPDSPNGEKIVAEVHSHGAYEGYPDEHFFSGENTAHNSEENKKNLDKGTDIGALNYYGRLGYLANHRGQLRVYNPETGEVNSVTTELPCDSSDPIQYNKNVVQKSYDNIINLNHITFNSDKAIPSKDKSYLTVKDLRTKKDFDVIRKDDGSYKFKPE